jgi:hypothetical protein
MSQTGFDLRHSIPVSRLSSRMGRPVWAFRTRKAEYRHGFKIEG